MFIVTDYAALISMAEIPQLVEADFDVTKDNFELHQNITQMSSDSLL